MTLRTAFSRAWAVIVTVLQSVAVLVWGAGNFLRALTVRGFMACGHWLAHVLTGDMAHHTWGDYGRTRTCIQCGRVERRVEGHTRGGRVRYYWRAEPIHREGGAP